METHHFTGGDSPSWQGVPEIFGKPPVFRFLMRSDKNPIIVP